MTSDRSRWWVLGLALLLAALYTLDLSLQLAEGDPDPLRFGLTIAVIVLACLAAVRWWIRPKK
jgi:hypothetical protein